MRFWLWPVSQARYIIARSERIASFKDWPIYVLRFWGQGYSTMSGDAILLSPRHLYMNYVHENGYNEVLNLKQLGVDLNAITEIPDYLDRIFVSLQLLGHEGDGHCGQVERLSGWVFAL